MTPRSLKPESPLFESSLDLARRGQHQAAVQDLTEVLGRTTLHPQLRAKAVEALCRISRLAEAAGDLHHAEIALVEALRRAPGFADLHYRLGRLRVAAQKRVEARRDLETALRLNPRYVAARLELSLLDAREGRLGEALETLRTLGQEARVGEPRAFGQGLRSLEHADWEEAGALLRHALQLDAPGIDAVIQEFHQRMTAGDRAGAAEAVRVALQGHEGFADLHYLLGTAELEEGHLDDALSSLARALEIHPDYHAARVQLARALEGLGDVAQAEEQVSLVLQADPQHPKALELRERWSRLRRRRAGDRPREAHVRAPAQAAPAKDEQEP